MSEIFTAIIPIFFFLMPSAQTEGLACENVLLQLANNLLSFSQCDVRASMMRLSLHAYRPCQQSIRNYPTIQPSSTQCVQMSKFLGCDAVSEKIRGHLASALKLNASNCKTDSCSNTDQSDNMCRIAWNQVRHSVSLHLHSHCANKFTQPGIMLWLSTLEGYCAGAVVSDESSRVRCPLNKAAAMIVLRLDTTLSCTASIRAVVFRHCTS